MKYGKIFKTLYAQHLSQAECLGLIAVACLSAHGSEGFDRHGCSLDQNKQAGKQQKHRLGALLCLEVLEKSECCCD